MKFWIIFRVEFLYQLRRTSTWWLLAVFFFLGFLVMRIVSNDDGTYLNAPSTIAFFTVYAGMIWVLIGGVVAGDIASRDITTRMYSITYTFPVQKFSYLGGRFLAALALNILILLSLYVGFLFSFYGPGARSEFLGPFSFASYLINFSFIALPVVIVVTSIQYSFAALSNSVITAYIVSIFLLIFSQLGSMIIEDGLGWQKVGNFMNLFETKLISENDGWNPIEKNTRMIALEGLWLWNRVMWLGIATGVLAFTYFRFQMVHIKPKVKWSVLFWRRRTQEHLSTMAGSGISYIERYDSIRDKLPSINYKFGFLTYVSQLFAITWASLKMILKSTVGFLLVAVIAIGTGLYATQYMENKGVPLFARTAEVLNIITPSLNSLKTPWIIIPLLIIFYAGELVWREREARMDEIFHITPVPNWVIFFGKFLGLALVITIWTTFLIMAGIINQLVMGHYNFKISVFLKAVLGIQLINYLLFALLMFVIQVIVNQKYIGHMLAFCAYGFILYAPMLGVEHKMLIYASDVNWFYSDMIGFGPFFKPIFWFKFYWLSWAFLISVLAILFWVRSNEGDLRTRFHHAKERFTQHRTALILAVSLILISGGYLFYNTNVINEYQNTAEMLEMRAEYERRYGQYENIIQPVLVQTKLHVEIYPHNQTADINGTYYLKNRSATVIDYVHLSIMPSLSISKISFNKDATPFIYDTEIGYIIFSLQAPLEPGDSIQMNFKVHVNVSGFTNSGVDLSISENGSYIKSDEWMPIIGYDQDRSLGISEFRKKYGLPSRPERPSLYDTAARYEARHAQPIDLETIIGTSKDQTAVAPGTLINKWIEGERQYFHYATDAPIFNDFSFFSARYALREVQWFPELPDSGQDISKIAPHLEGKAVPVTIQIFYHPMHDENIGRMIQSVQASLNYYTKEFGPYPYSHFRVLERPGHGRGMHAEAMTIDYQEGFSLMNPQTDSLNLPYHIMAHEVAHQWWGYQFAPAAVEGSGVLTESLATYSAMLVVEETLGYDHLLLYLNKMRNEYEVPRSLAAPPLLQAKGSFMNYLKGPFALFTLRNYIGKDNVTTALRKTFREYPSSPPLPTTLDLYRELRAVTPDSLQYLLHDLFAANTLWELETEKATAEQTKTCDWQLTLNVATQKMRVDSMGIKETVSINDWIEIGVYAPLGEGESSPRVLYLQKHRIVSEKQTISLNLSEKPGLAGIDPNKLLIDITMENNIKKVKIEVDETGEKGI